MYNNLRLRLQTSTALSDIHHILLTPSLNETAKLQAICDKLARTLSCRLVWGGLLKQDKQLHLTAVASDYKQSIQGITLNCDEEASEPLSKCLSEQQPVYLSGGMKVFNAWAFSHLPPEIQSLPLKLYPLSIFQQSVGILAVETAETQHASEHELLQLVAQQTGFALGSLRALTEASPQQDQKLAAAAFDHALEGILITDANGTILAANPAVSRITGYSLEDLLGQNPRILKSDRHDESFYRSLWDGVSTNNAWKGEIWNQRKNGEVYPEWLSISAIKDEQGNVQNFIGIFIDISKQKEAEKYLLYQAYHDKLTGLANRELFLDRLNMALLQAKRNQQEVALLVINLDHFRSINDTFGHPQGDLVLQQAALKIQSCLRQNDTLARMGGDEFAIVLQDFIIRKDVRLAADRMIAALEGPIRFGQQEVHLSASIGISFYPEDGDSASILLKRADTAMHCAKKNGRKQLHFFQIGMDGYSSQRIEMENMLRGAIENGEFQLYYQPQFDLQSGRLIGSEALLRWEHPNMGQIPPEQFLPLAEETGMILPIGEWVLNEVCSQSRAWQRKGLKPLRIAANLSDRQFALAGLSKNISSLLSEFDLDPEFLELELTENAAMQQVETSLKTFSSLKQTGINMTIDDFGSGYSSLSYLKQFPIDRLKIDRTFIADITRTPNDAAIVAAIISMARCMDLKVIAEGVETNEQLSFLRMHGCNEAQGYLLGRPQPAGQFGEYLAKV